MSMSVIGVACCVNHGAKKVCIVVTKAKYRLLSRISEGEDEMFYCSKCAVNLLQQGFKVEELKN